MKIILLQKSLDITCGISRVIRIILSQNNPTFTYELWILGGNDIDFITNNKNKIRLFSSKLELIISIFKLHEQVLFVCFHRLFDFLLYIKKKSNKKVRFVSIVGSKTLGKRRISYKADHLIAVSNAIKNHLIDYFFINEKKISVIYNFVNLPEISITKSKAEVMNSFGLNSNKKIIGFVGRFDIPEKGIDILLSAFKKLYEQNINLQLVMIGSGKDITLVNLYRTKYHLEIFTREEKENIYNYYNVFDIIVLPSRIDPCPLVMFEAGTLSLPFIGSNVDGIPEIITNGITGLLFESEKIDELFNKIKALITNPDYAKQLGGNLFNEVMSKFTADVILPKYEKVFNSFISL